MNPLLGAQLATRVDTAEVAVTVCSDTVNMGHAAAKASLGDLSASHAASASLATLGQHVGREAAIHVARRAVPARHDMSNSSGSGSRAVSRAYSATKHQINSDSSCLSKAEGQTWPPPKLLRHKQTYTLFAVQTHF